MLMPIKETLKITLKATKSNYSSCPKSPKGVFHSRSLNLPFLPSTWIRNIASEASEGYAKCCSTSPVQPEFIWASP